MKCKNCNGDMQEKAQVDYLTVYWCPVCGTLCNVFGFDEDKEEDWNVPTKAMK
jgi:hypothetical protein